jgi:phosphatidylglycerophosphate synthase
MEENGNKLPNEYNDPIDTFILDFTKHLNPYFKKLYFTPNGITTISLIFGLITCFLYYKKKYMLASLFFILAYFFDCMDGQYARTYNMQSKFGALYDNLSDHFIAFILMFLFIFNKYISKKYKIIIGLIVFISYIGTTYYFGCQEKYYSEKNKNNNNYVEAPSLLKNYCINTHDMKYIRYFGTGFFNLIICLIIFSHTFFSK